MFEIRASRFFVLFFFSLPLISLYSNDRSIVLTNEEKAWIEEKNTVQVRVVNFPYFLIVEEDSPPSGLVIDILDLIAERTGVLFEYIETDQHFSDALEGLKNKTGPDLITTMMQTEERKQYINFTEEYIRIPRVIFTSEGSQIITGMNDLSGKTLSLAGGTVVHRQVEENYPDIILQPYKSDAESIEALSLGLVDAYIGNLTVGTYLILQNDFVNVKVAAPTDLEDHIFSMGARKDWPELRSILNKGLQSISYEEMRTLQNKYFSVTYDFGIRPIDIFKWVLFVIIISGILLFFFFRWNRRLNNEIKERISAEERLKKSQALLNETGAIAKVGGWEIDLISNELVWTDEVFKIHEVDRSYVPTVETAIDFYHPDFRTAITEAVNKALNSGEPFELEAKIITGKGKILPIIAKGKGITDNGKVTKIIGTFQDIELRKKAEDALRESEKEKENLQRQLIHRSKMDAIGELAGGMAHDFNNVLCGILNASQLLKSPKWNLDEKSLKYVNMIIEASIRASDLIEKLLAFSRKGKIVTTTLDVHKIMNNTVEILRRTIDKKVSITLIEEARKSLINGDRSAIESAIINLGINASHAMPDGGAIEIRTGNISLDQRACELSSFDIKPGDFIEIVVKDEGCGVPPEDLERIFEPFYTTKKMGSGTGLGLSAVYGTILEHRGSIEVQSSVGKETLFSLLLPCSDRKIEDHKREDILISGAGTILLVDDEEMNRILNKDLLETLGYKVLLAENGLEAMEIFKAQHSEIDIVLMDMVMPKMNGAEAFRQMSEIDENCRIIIASGYLQDENMDELIKRGAAGFIHKPFMISEISQLLAEVRKRS